MASICDGSLNAQNGGGSGQELVSLQITKAICVCGMQSDQSPSGLYGDYVKNLSYLRSTQLRVVRFTTVLSNGHVIFIICRAFVITMDFAWTTGGDPYIAHRKQISAAGYGEVHLVRLFSITAHNRWLMNGTARLVCRRIITNWDKVFARKIIRPTGMLSDADIQNEARLIDKLCAGSHKNIVTVFRHEHRMPFYFLDMEFCDMSLEEYIKNDIPEPVSRNLDKIGSNDTIWALLVDVPSGLEFIHGHQVIHGNLKPRNGNLFFFEQKYAEI
jgi:hypothetical protein